MDSILDELEEMASGVAGEVPAADEEAIERWRYLFSYSSKEVERRIEQFRSNLNGSRILDFHWESVRIRESTDAHNLESYEYSLKLKSEAANDTAVRDIAGLVSLPEVISGTGNAVHKIRIIPGLPSEPEIDPGRMAARKDLCPSSRCPTLGLDTTLPQFRLPHDHALVKPAQDQCQVFYFVYGTLTDPERLTRLLSLSEDLMLSPATVRGEVLQNWGAKYKALVDGPESSSVSGSTYEVAHKEHEDALCRYETEMYEVLRCDIVMLDTERVVKGLTLWFVRQEFLD
ncbi:hypothetical protein NA57DRAFT_79392 [Rhizodiscina lignyota]|uniref:Putative gamma-glutamylcyclotransferase n=1 Tax=Rhizodiscina lignyota TaxID=1504668 RepID=A0A9P4M7C2_9PEZI|nr:hypothetical protein NA57DRAFT_79392 [Rhizodiscina lignyota]